MSNEIFIDAAGKLVKLDKNGRPCPVAADGFRARGKATRPPGMDPTMWWSSSPKQRAEVWAKIKAREDAAQPGGGGATSSNRSPPAVCCPMGALAFLADSDPTFKAWADMANESAALASSAGCIVPVEMDDEEPSWLAWEREISEEIDYLDHLKSLASTKGARIASAAPASGSSAGGVSYQTIAPAMPCRGSCSFPHSGDVSHREKTAERIYPFSALVARPAGKAEIAQSPRLHLPWQASGTDFAQ